MTIDPDDDRNMREFARSVFGNVDHAARDIVASTGLTREDLERQSAAYMRSEQGLVCHGIIPGEVIEGPDGEPLGVTESREVTTSFGGTFITAAQAEQFGIESGDLPGIFIIDNEEQ